MKRKTIFGFIEPTIIVSIIVAMILLGAGVFAVFVVINTTEDELGPETTESFSYPTTTYTETFADDTNGSSPTATWYTYSETGWDWANVTNLTGRTDASSYNITDSAGDQDWSEFNWTEDDYEYFQFYFKINDTTQESINITMHNLTHALGHLYINTTYILFFNDTHVESWNETIANDTWYQIRFDFNESNDTIRCRIWDNTSTLLNDSYANSTDLTNVWSVNFTGSSVAGESVEIFVDDFTLYDIDVLSSNVTQTRPDVMTTADSVFNIIGVLMIIGSILLIVGVAIKSGYLK